jgi:hypothetical protein
MVVHSQESEHLNLKELHAFNTFECIYTYNYGDQARLLHPLHWQLSRQYLCSQSIHHQTRLSIVVEDGPIETVFELYSQTWKTRQHLYQIYIKS